MKIFSINEFASSDRERIVLYHGTQSKFSTFDNSFVNSGWGQQEYGYGFYLTDDYKTAKEYSRGGVVIKVSVPSGKYLSYKNVISQERTSIAKKFFKYYTTESEYGKELYPDRQSRDDFWNMECRYILDAETGGDIYGTISSMTGDDKETSEFLRGIGYIGLTYSEDGKWKVTNYLIFDGRDITVL